MEILDIRKPTKFGNSLYMLMSGILDENKFYKVIRVSDKKIIIEESEAVGDHSEKT